MKEYVYFTYFTFTFYFSYEYLSADVHFTYPKSSMWWQYSKITDCTPLFSPNPTQQQLSLKWFTGACESCNHEQE